MKCVMAITPFIGAYDILNKSPLDLGSQQIFGAKENVTDIGIGGWPKCQPGYTILDFLIGCDFQLEFDDYY